MFVILHFRCMSFVILLLYILMRTRITLHFIQHWSLSFNQWVCSIGVFNQMWIQHPYQAIRDSFLLSSWVSTYISICHTVFLMNTHPRCNWVNHMFYVWVKQWKEDLCLVARRWYFRSTYWSTWLLSNNTECKIHFGNTCSTFLVYRTVFFIVLQ